MTALFQKILEISLNASWMIAAVLLLRFLLKRSPRKYTGILWIAVLLRLICPIALPTQFSLLPEAYTAWVQETIFKETGSGEWAGTEGPAISYEQITFPGQEPNAGRTEGQTENQEPFGEEYASEWKAGGFPLWTGFLWLGGITALLLWNGAACLHLTRHLCKNRHPQEPGVWSVAGLETPFVMGVLRPQIYLPQDLDRKEQSFILNHERAHIQRKDPQLKLLGFFALCIHWFNPFVWIAFYLMSSDMETACDEAVLGKMGDEIREDYSAALLHLSVKGPSFIRAGSFFGEWNPKKRIRHILHYQKQKKHITFFTAILTALAAAAVFFAFGPQKEESAVWAADQTEQKKESEALDRTELMEGEGIAGNTDSAGNTDGENREQTAEAHLELVEIRDYAPYYKLRFQKIEDSTGKKLSFEQNTALFEEQETAPAHVEIKPEEELWLTGYGFDGVENPADSIWIDFWNLNEAESAEVILDGLEYRLELPKTVNREVKIEQEVEGTDITVENLQVYPNALLLTVSGMNLTNYGNPMHLSYTKQGEEKRIDPVRTAYRGDAGEMYLIFALEEEAPENGYTFRVGEPGKSQGELIYHDLPLH